MGKILFLNNDGVDLGCTFYILQYNEIVSKERIIKEMLKNVTNKATLETEYNLVKERLEKSNICEITTSLNLDFKTYGLITFDARDIRVYYRLYLDNKPSNIEIEDIIFSDWSEGYDHVQLYNENEFNESQLDVIQRKTEMYKKIVNVRKTRMKLQNSVSKFDTHMNVRIEEVDDMIKLLLDKKTKMISEYEEYSEINTEIDELDYELRLMQDEFDNM